MAFKMKGWSPFKQNVPTTKNNIKKKRTKKHPTDIDLNKDEMENPLDDQKKLPTFRKGDVTISQHDKDGNKRYNIVGEE